MRDEVENLKKWLWGLANNKRIIANLVQKWGKNNAQFYQLAQNGRSKIFLGLNGMVYNWGQNSSQTDRQKDRQTDRQTNSLTPYMGVCGFFLQVKICYLPTRASLAGDKKSLNPLLFQNLLKTNFYIAVSTYIFCLSKMSTKMSSKKGVGLVLSKKS